MPKKRGFKFTVNEIEHLLDCIDVEIPVGNPEWEKVWQEHNSAYPTKDRTVESLKRKFYELANKKIPTGDRRTEDYGVVS